MAASADILEQNRALADPINQEARANPASAYAGKYVGLANGKVVAVADTLTEALCLLEQIEPDRDRRYCIRASQDYSTVEDIWEMYPIYGIRVEIPQLGFDERVEAACVPKTPAGLDGIACFRFLDRFAYGNFAVRGEIGLEA